MPESQEPTEADEHIELKNRELAAFLAWLIPGLGHLYQGRYAKAVLFFVCIMGTFAFGVYLGSSNATAGDGTQIGWGRVVYFAWRGNDKRLQYFCQVGIGLPALPALVQANRMYKNREVWWKGFMAPPRRDDSRKGEPNGDQPSAHTLHRELYYFDLATAYTMIAGLLNILAVCDAWGGPVFIEPAKKEDEDEDKEQAEGKKKAEGKGEEEDASPAGS